jgi:hypothetical protein
MRILDRPAHSLFITPSVLATSLLLIVVEGDTTVCSYRNVPLIVICPSVLHKCLCMHIPIDLVNILWKYILIWQHFNIELNVSTSIYPCINKNTVRWHTSSAGTVPNILMFNKFFSTHGVGNTYLTVVLCCIRLPELPVFFLTTSLSFRAMIFFLWHSEYFCFAICLVINLCNLFSELTWVQ